MHKEKRLEGDARSPKPMQKMENDRSKNMENSKKKEFDRYLSNYFGFHMMYDEILLLNLCWILDWIINSCSIGYSSFIQSGPFFKIFAGGAHR